MSKTQKIVLTFLRITLGWLFFYAGITKVIDPNWSAAGYIAGAKSFGGFFNALLDPAILPVVNFLNEWGLTLLGLSLILGLFVRISSWLGALLMALYYLATLDFPYPNAHAYLVDEHIIYILVLILLALWQAGRTWGLDSRLTFRRR